MRPLRFRGTSSVTVGSGYQDLIFCNSGTWGSPVINFQSSGNVGIGTASPWTNLTIGGTNSSPGVGIENNGSTSAQYPGITIYDFEGSVGGTPDITMLGSRGNSTTSAALHSGDSLGKVEGDGVYDATVDSGQGAYMGFVAEGTFSSSSYPTAIVFSTVPSGSTSLSEVMRLNNAGNVGIGTTSPEATLDVSGYMRLAKNSSQPVACSSTHDGAIALTAVYTLCVCKGSSSAWYLASNGATACTW